MELKVKLFSEDYLHYQLFAASQSIRIQKKRKLEWLLTSLFFLILGIIFYFTDIAFLFYYFLAVSILCLLFYPAYSRRRYRKHYLKHTREVLKNNFGKAVSVVFANDHIETKDADSEAKIKYAQINEINETGTHFFLQFHSGSALIIPKRGCPDITIAKNYLMSLAKSLNIKYNPFLNWKWK